jgi:RNA polymerase sigma factor (sigma-70 family)
MLRQSDEDLARAAGAGDERAFTTIVERHGATLYRYCRSIVRHDQDAQDVVQTTMVQAFASLRKTPLEAPLKPWLFRIAHNESISLLRRRRPTDDLDAQYDVASAPIEGQVEDRERLTHLVSDLQELPERQRSALVMRELSGLSHDEIAVALGVTVSQTKQAIFEARRGLEAAAVGRDMKCEPVQRAISDGDGRVLRARHMRSHVRTCRQCRAMRDAIGTRERDLAILFPPLPVAAAGTMLDRIVEAGSTNGDAVAGGVAGAAATATAGKAIVGAFSGKALALVAALVTATGAATYVATEHAPSHGGSPDGALTADAGTNRGTDPVLVAGAPLLGGSATTPGAATSGTAGAAPSGGLVGTTTTKAGGGLAGTLGGAAPATGSAPPRAAESPAGAATQTAGNGAATATKTAHDVASSGTNAAHDVANKTSDATHHVVDTASNTVHDVTSGANQTVHDTVGTAGQAVQDVTSGSNQTVQHVTTNASKVVGDVVTTSTKATGDLVNGVGSTVGGLLGGHHH